MDKYYAISTIDGQIRLIDQPPSEGQFGLAVGEFGALVEVIHATAPIYFIDHNAPGRYRVPDTRDDAEPRANLEAIARYIQELGQRDVPGFRPLGV